MPIEVSSYGNWEVTRTAKPDWYEMQYEKDGKKYAVDPGGFRQDDLVQLRDALNDMLGEENSDAD